MIISSIVLKIYFYLKDRDLNTPISRTNNRL